MKFIKNRTAWIRWKNKETDSSDTVPEPECFPCYAYLTIQSWGYEEPRALYLYATDVNKMKSKIDENIQS